LLSIGQKILEYRVKSRFSQEILAEKLSVSRQSVSKWELGLSLPETDKIIAMSKLFSVTTDELLNINKKTFTNNQLRFGIYLIVKDFKESLYFYEIFLSIRASKVAHNIFAQFFFDGIYMSIMNESNLKGHDYSGSGDHKFALNFWVHDLQAEYKRIKNLDIGKFTEIRQVHTNYHYFNLYDPDNNVIEITGNYKN
jgi:transcriptional regulator with XRE-family HTH domain